MTSATGRAGAARPPRPPAPRRALELLGWLAAATLVALTKFAPQRGTPLGPANGRLAAGLPALPDSTGNTVAPPSPAAATPVVPPAPATASGPAAPSPSAPPAPSAATPAPATPPTPAAPQAARPARVPRPVRILAEVESAFVADRGRPDARDWRRELPRPFAALRRTASPLIMPRLRLPRVLSPDFEALRGLSARARPGQPVHVRLTAYCLTGRTARGTATRAGIIAADPHIFPLARSVHLFAAGRYLGRFRVEDTGGAVRGPHIDIWTPDCADARAFGSRAGVASLARFGED